MYFTHLLAGLLSAHCVLASIIPRQQNSTTEPVSNVGNNDTTEVTTVGNGSDSQPGTTNSSDSNGGQADLAAASGKSDNEYTTAGLFNCRSPSRRDCWNPFFSVRTDYDAITPFTGTTRTYNIELTEVDSYTTPDGQVKRQAMLINGQLPGPTIEANWGDYIKVTVTNKLKSNGTSIHWHGMRMLNNNVNDGVNGITECPLPPGSSKTYTFLAEQYGTTWYHSHFSTQYANGVYGPLVIHGPSSANYDIDLGPLAVNDHYYAEAEEIALSLKTPPARGPPAADNILFNGRNVKADKGTGEYYRMQLTPGKKHLLRLYNPSVDTSISVSMAGHNFTIIQSDLVPVKPKTVSSVFLPIGARYHVIIDANQKVDNYWLNATAGDNLSCGRFAVDRPAMIMSYRGAAPGLPQDPGAPPAINRCVDDIDLVPVVSRQVNLSKFNKDNTLPVALAPNARNVLWTVRESAMQVNWSMPSLEYVRQRKPFERERNVLRINPSSREEWSVWVIQNESPVSHPMHLHGHDLVVLGRSEPFAVPRQNKPVKFDFANDLNSLKLNNPVRRDVTTLPAFGWLVVAFRADNPGAWLFHCHVAWHVGQGLSVQYIEREAEIRSRIDLAAMDKTCAAWKAYVPPFPQIDSGLSGRRL